MNTFKKGDKVIQIGTKEPIMEVRGHTAKPSDPETKIIILNTYTCYWETHGPNWKVFKESELEFFSNT